MIDIAAIRQAFPDLSDVQPVAGISGQKDVLVAQRKGQSVCLKLVKRYSGDEDRTVREIEAVARLHSDCVPAIYDYGEKLIGGEDRYFIIEQFIDGPTYRRVLQQQPVQPLGTALDLLNSLLSACVEFETANLVHRDIKPENLICDSQGKIWILDFGLARHLDKTSLTLTGQHFGVGTFGYSAPEQFRNIKHAIDIRSDLFSVGVVIYESLSGSHPFAFAPPDVMKTIRKMENEDLPLLAIPGDDAGGLSTFLNQLLQRFPSRRPQTAGEALQWYLPIYARLKGYS